MSGVSWWPGGQGLAVVIRVAQALVPHPNHTVTFSGDCIIVCCSQKAVVVIVEVKALSKCFCWLG